jgi:solute carrier family 39 (zinc transporter), member 1/2/3
LLRDTYNANAANSLVTQGVLEALAAGILLYDGISNLIVPFFNSTIYLEGTNTFQATTTIAMWVGALAMSVIGYWA